MEALRQVVAQLDAALPAVRHLRPRQVRRWERRSRAEFLHLAKEVERGRQRLAVAWDVVADLRELVQQTRIVAAEAGVEDPDW